MKKLQHLITENNLLQPFYNYAIFISKLLTLPIAKARSFMTHLTRLKRKTDYFSILIPFLSAKMSSSYCFIFFLIIESYSLLFRSCDRKFIKVYISAYLLQSP